MNEGERTRRPGSLTRHPGKDDRLTSSFTEYVRVIDHAGDVAEFAVLNGRLYVRTMSDGVRDDKVERMANFSWVSLAPDVLQELLQFMAANLAKS